MSTAWNLSLPGESQSEVEMAQEQTRGEPVALAYREPLYKSDTDFPCREASEQISINVSSATKTKIIKKLKKTKYYQQRC